MACKIGVGIVIFVVAGAGLGVGIYFIVQVGENERMLINFSL